MNNLEDRVSGALRDQATRSGPFTGMAERAIPLARRLRTRQRVSAGVVGLAALAVLGPLGWSVVPGHDGSFQPSASPIHPIDLDVTELPKGPPPAVPYVEDGVIHDGDRRIPLRTTEKGVRTFAPFREGYIVEFWNGTIELVNHEGRAQGTLPSFPEISADGELAAFESEVDPDQDTTLHLTDMRTGKAIDSVTVKGVAVVRGFAGDNVVFDDGDGNGPAAAWNTRSGKVSYFDGLDAGDADGSRWLGVTAREDLFGVGRTSRDCSGMYDRSGEPVWRSCDDIMIRMSTDGQYVFGGDNDSDATVVRDTADGLMVFEITGAPIDYGRATAEPDGSFLAVAGVENDDGQLTGEALIRCRTNGSCERVSDIEPTNDLLTGAKNTPAIVTGDGT